MGCKEEESKVVSKQTLNIEAEIAKVKREQGGIQEPKKESFTYKPNMKSVANVMAIEQFRKQAYYESIAAYLEGFRGNLYNDNVGLAWAFGWNVSMQSRKTNEWLTSEIGITPNDKSLILPLSANTSPGSTPRVSISPEQGIHAVSLMRKTFEGGGGIRAIITPAVYDKLKPNEQAALVYHTYKVGPGGAAKYKTMNGMIREYVKNPTPEKAHEIGGQFKYSYMLRGQKMYDTRSGAYLAALFSNPEAYGAMIGSNSAPKDLPEILAATEFKDINVSKPIPPQIESLDTFSKVKEDMLIHGERFAYYPIEVVWIKPKKEKRQFTHMPYGSM